MKCIILHESKNRLRIHVDRTHMSLHEADILEYYLRKIDGVTSVKVFDRTRDAILCFTTTREEILTAMNVFRFEDHESLVPEHTGRAMNRAYQDRLTLSVISRYSIKLFVPTPIRTLITMCRTIKYVIRGIRSLLNRRIEVALLDATAISVSMIRGDTNTASSVMFLLRIGEILEEWTHKKSVDDLARTMSLNVDQVWIKNDGQEMLVPISKITAGDQVVIRTGNMIPLDGKVLSGEATVNQASITGESLPILKEVGSYVYAGTVVEEGECVIGVDKASGDGRYDRIVKMIEESEKLKSSTESKASHLADQLVPYSLGGTILTYLLTRNTTKALSILMVDFSCALKLSMPLAVLSAMRESSTYDISVKGGKFLEAVAGADTIVFDKTGTLTHACPRVAQVVGFNDQTEEEMLRLAACLEEHYPHSVANAVVSEAKSRNLSHEERHSKVEYVVAHGISSIVDGEKVVIGSYHFLFEDEGCIVREADQERFDQLSNAYSHLYLAISGVLSAVICIEDQLREEASTVIHALKKLGIRHVVMMTGDSERTAKAIAAQAGVDEYYSEVLPEDKANYIRKAHQEGRKVIMIGDGVNDSPALSEADAGIAIANGAAIAREIADITISADNLYGLLDLKMLSDALMQRINGNYRFIISFNLLLILFGVAGVIQPATSALLHNASTIAISLKSMGNLRPETKSARQESYLIS